MLCNTGSWSEGDFMQQKTGPACCYITLDPDPQATLYEKNRASKLLYNTGIWTAVDFIPDELCQQAVI